MKSLLRRWIYGLGGVSQNTMQNAPVSMASPIYNIGLGVSPVLIGVAMALPRVWEMFFDPWLGRQSDKTRTVLGRRRPYIFTGSILTGLLFVVIWWVPTGWSRDAQGAWMIALMLLYYTAYSIFAVPFAAFTIEVVRGDESERLRLNGAITSFGNLSAIPMGWLYWLCNRPVFGNPVHGMRYVGLIFGLIIGACAFIPALVYRESPRFIVQEDKTKPALPTMPLKKLLQFRPLQLLLLSAFSLVFGFSLVSQLGFYVLAYYACRGDIETASYIYGLSSTVHGLLGTVVAPFVAWIARRLGRRHALMPFLGLGGLGSLSMWWSMSPQHPYCYIASASAVTFCVASFWTITPAILGTISDDIERRTGFSCQGMISGIFGIASKLAVSISFLLTGYVLLFCGFDAKLPLATMGVPLERMRLAYSLLPFMGLAVAALSIWYCKVSTGPHRASSSTLVSGASATD
jgi:GPH family glycoside/pentoside/hexuronide:cation symporter